MILLIAFLLMLAGSVNWLLIGLLQFDFVAGLFGYQASIFSRIVYIVIGAGAAYFVFKLLAQKGKIELFNFKKNKSKKKAYNVEAAEENLPKHHGGYTSDDGTIPHRQENHDIDGEKRYDNLFDEHFSNDD